VKECLSTILPLDNRKAIEQAWIKGANKMIKYNNNNRAPGPCTDHKIYGPLSNCSDTKREQIKNAMRARVNWKEIRYPNNKLKNTKKLRVKNKTKHYQDNKLQRLNSNLSADENSSLNLNPSADITPPDFSSIPNNNSTSSSPLSNLQFTVSSLADGQKLRVKFETKNSRKLLVKIKTKK
jgi:hypothetical protein